MRIHYYQLLCRAFFFKLYYTDYAKHLGLKICLISLEQWSTSGSGPFGTPSGSANLFFRLKIQHILFMAHTSVFNIQELLEHILHFLVVDKSLYPTLFVCRLWYRCGAPILWRCIKLKRSNARKIFMEIIHGGRSQFIAWM
jgi:hypothetical protein